MGDIPERSPSSMMWKTTAVVVHVNWAAVRVCTAVVVCHHNRLLEFYHFCQQVENWTLDSTLRTEPWDLVLLVHERGEGGGRRYAPNAGVFAVARGANKGETGSKRQKTTPKHGCLKTTCGVMDGLPTSQNSCRLRAAKPSTAAM